QRRYDAARDEDVLGGLSVLLAHRTLSSAVLFTSYPLLGALRILERIHAALRLAHQSYPDRETRFHSAQLLEPLQGLQLRSRERRPAAHHVRTVGVQPDVPQEMAGLELLRRGVAIPPMRNGT